MTTDPINVTPTAAATPMNSNERLFAILCHISPFLSVPILLPLIIFLVKRQDREASAYHAAEVLNFHLTMLIATLVGGILTLILIGGLVLLTVAIITIVCAIIGAIKASKNELCRYPLTIRLVHV